MKGKILESISTYLHLGSGWRFVNVEYLDIYISKYKPLVGKSYKPLPKVIESKKVVIDMKNNKMCFKWAVIRALNPIEKNSE